MDVFEYLHKQARITSPDDITTFHEACDGLPPHDKNDDFGNEVPASLGRHSVGPLRRFVKESNAFCLFQVGFNVGVSTAILFELGVRRIVSVEIRDSSEVRRAEEYCRTKWGHEIVFGDSTSPETCGKIPRLDYDSAFIDGDHSLLSVRSDIGLCKAVGVRDFLMDDMLPQYGSGLPAVMERDDLKMLWWDGNMAAFRFLA